ncbi:MAG: alpha/beta fold hydrolase, partial [Sulfolobales archaeon]
VKLKNVEMSFRLLSRKSSKAVVLVHGNLSSSAIWEDIMSSVQEDFDVVAPDLRGFWRQWEGSC